MSHDRVRDDLGAAVSASGGSLAAAERLCRACVDLFDVDGAAISLLHQGATRGTFGSSGELSRRLDEFQFTLGEGPCLDAVSAGRPVLVADLADRHVQRWPAFTEAVLSAGIRAVFALPVSIGNGRVGALDLFRKAPGGLSDGALTGSFWAAELAALPLLDLVTADLDWAAAGEGGDGWSRLASLERVEVYQATGMIMAAWDVGSMVALARLRAHAYALGCTASELAWSIVERRVSLGTDGRPGVDGAAFGARS